VDGGACGLAGTVKYWAALPALVLLALCVVSRPVGMTNGGPVPALTGSVERIKRAAWFGGGLVAGFAVPVLPFAAPWPGLFLRSTLLDQASRAGSRCLSHCGSRTSPASPTC